MLYFGPPFLLSHIILLFVICTYHFNLPSCTFLDISPTFVPYSVRLSNTTDPSQHPHFHHVILLLLRFLYCPCHRPIHHCWSYYCRPLDSQVNLWSHRTSDTLFLTVCVIFTAKSPPSANVDPRYANEVTLSKLPPCRLISEDSS